MRFVKLITLSCLQFVILFAQVPGVAETAGRVGGDRGSFPYHREIPDLVVPNRGQVPSNIHFLIRNPSLQAVFLSGGTAVSRPGSTLFMEFAGGNATAIEGIRPQISHASFLTGNNPSQWKADLPTYGGVVYRNLYPGIDLQ